MPAGVAGAELVLDQSAVPSVTVNVPVSLACRSLWEMVATARQGCSCKFFIYNARSDSTAPPLQMRVVLPVEEVEKHSLGTERMI